MNEHEPASAKWIYVPSVTSSNVSDQLASLEEELRQQTEKVRQLQRKEEQARRRQLAEGRMPTMGNWNSRPPSRFLAAGAHGLLSANTGAGLSQKAQTSSSSDLDPPAQSSSSKNASGKQIYHTTVSRNAADHGSMPGEALRHGMAISLARLAQIDQMLGQTAEVPGGQKGGLRRGRAGRRRSTKDLDLYGSSGVPLAVPGR